MTNITRRAMWKSGTIALRIELRTTWRLGTPETRRKGRNTRNARNALGITKRECSEESRTSSPHQPITPSSADRRVSWHYWPRVHDICLLTKEKKVDRLVWAVFICTQLQTNRARQSRLLRIWNTFKKLRTSARHLRQSQLLSLAAHTGHTNWAGLFGGGDFFLSFHSVEL